MSRFEITLTGGDKILVDHSGEGIRQILSDLATNAFLLLREIRVGATGVDAEVIVASRSVALVRSIEGDSRQNSTFRPKR